MNTIFITGASSGIGKATAKLFAEKNWTVMATMRNPSKEAELGELTSYKNVALYPLDITNPTQVKETVSTVLKQFNVDVLFNNAGYGMKARFEDMDEAMMKKSIDTNILGMIRVTQAFITHFKARKSGTILTTTSLAGEMGLILDGVYAADKWAVTGMCEMLYFERAPFNIRVKTLVPGVVKTGFKMEGGGTMPEEYKEYVDKQVQFLMPDLNDIEDAQEAAQDAYFAVTDDDDDRMTYVTGKTAKAVWQKRQEIGDEAFRKYYKGILLNK